MIEVALFTGVGLLGYILANQYKDEQTHKPREHFVIPRAQPDVLNNRVVETQAVKGHGNMVPFFGSKVTQN